MSATRSDAAPASGLPAAIRDHLIYLAVVAAYCVPYLWQRDLFFRDETRYGAVVREMMRNDAWLTLTIGNQPYLEKPPLFFTLIRGVAEILGTTAPWMFLAVVAVTAFFFVAASDAFLRAAGFDRPTTRLANLLLLAVPWVAFHMQTLRMDLLFSGFILLSTACYLRGVARDSANGWPLAGGALAAAAVLVKGPFGGLMPILGIVAFLLVTGRWRVLLRGDLLLSLAVALLPVAAWLWLLYVSFGEAIIGKLLGEQVIERAVSGRDAQRAWWYYLLWTPATLLPWLLLAPALASARVRTALRGALDLRQPPLLAVAIFVAVCFVLVNLVAQKNFPYLLPLVPGLMLGLALLWQRLEPAFPRLFDWFYVGLAAAALAGPPLLVWGIGFLPADTRADLAFFVSPAATGQAAAGMALAAIPLAIAARLRGAARLLGNIAAVAVLLAGLKAAALPDLTRAYSPRAGMALFAAKAPDGVPILIYGVYRGSLSYHLDKPHAYVAERKDLRAALAGGGAATVLTTAAIRDRQSALFRNFETVAESRLESTPLVLLHRPGTP